ncbi:hypothetical protein V9T40_003032 [Parthenolecanium corni]|uniref:AMP-dependent synthetase/ligase domain-containing protein n=1 Tax=Parthenolecanium corni TaxID=536013 RepID=A0AAN9Y7M8_9HEMI
MEVNCNLSIIRGPNFPVPKDTQLHQLFELNSRRNGMDDKVAIILEDTEQNIITHLSYASLEIKANQLARKILQFLSANNRKGVNKDGDYVITVCMHPSEKLIITLLAIWKVGAAYLPLDVNTPISRMEHIFSEVYPLMMITDQKVENSESSYVVNYDKMETEAKELPSCTLSENEILHTENPSPIAIILYTSGSTGVPKGVRLPHAVIMNRLSWQWRTFPYTNTERVCVFKTALTFVDAVAEIWGPLLFSDPRTLLIVPKHITKDPEKLIQVLDTYKVERLVLVPSLLQAIFMYLDMIKKQFCMNYNKLSSLKLWVCSGEPLPVSLVKKFFSQFDPEEYTLCNFYGSTEIMGDVSYYAIKSMKQLNFDDKIPIGIPLDNTTLYLLNQNFQPVKNGEIGELFVSGYNLAAGYVAGRDPEKFINNPFSSDSGHAKFYRTGDYGKIIDSVLLYEGRVDSQIKIRGQRVDLSEVQGALNKIDVVQKSAVLCYKPGDMNQAVIAFVTLSAGCTTSAKEIQNKLKESLVPYAIPQILITENIPLLNNGKVDRQKLLKMYANNADNERRNQCEFDYTDIENSKLKPAKCLFETIISVLGNTIQQPLSVNLNFYEIGGNSLNCIQTITRLRERGYFIGIADFISAPNLGGILSRMQHEKHVKENIPNVLDVKHKNFSKSKYKYEMLDESHRDAVFKIITDSFYEKADLEQWIIPKPNRECYTDLLEAIWEPLITKNFSFAVYSEYDEKYVGISLNFDAYDEPEVHINSNLTIIFEFLEYLEAPIRKKLPFGKRKLFHSFMMGTDDLLNAAQNIQVVICMENEILRIAEQKGFAGVFTTNTNPLTQQLGTDVFQYYTLLDYQVNQYVAQDGSKPFAMAPDSQKAIVSWKPI